MIVVDVSAHQDDDLTNIIEEHEPEVIVIKHYLPEEGDHWIHHCLLQAASAREHGKRIWAYVWAYQELSPEKSVQDTKALMNATGAERLYIDMEPYDGGYGLTWPNAIWLRRAVEECYRQGIVPRVYTGRWYWLGFMDNTEEFAHLPLWNAQYDDDPFRPYGGWTKEEGRQFTSTPIDVNYFEEDMRTPEQQFIIDVLTVNMTQRIEEAKADLRVSLGRLEILDAEVTDMIARLEAEWPNS